MSYSKKNSRRRYIPDTASRSDLKICEFANKRCYSKKDAQTTLNYAKTSKEKHKKPIRMYYCDFCNSYHLTSQEKRKED